MVVLTMAELKRYPFEVGRRGKPDELETCIAQLLGAHLLELNRNARFDLRVHGGWDKQRDQPQVHVSGEVSKSILLGHPTLADQLSQVILGYYGAIHRVALQRDAITIIYTLNDQDDRLAANRKAGDSGNPIAVAYRQGPLFLPWERYLAVGIRDLFDEMYHANGRVPPLLGEHTWIDELRGLRADGKINVRAAYEGTRLIGIEKVTIALEHEPFLSLAQLREQAAALVQRYLAVQGETYRCDLGTPRIIVNSADAWNTGGWRVDGGNREAKSYRDGFGPYGTMEDSFSGEDPSKPSGTGTFLARYIAVQIVSQGLADFARVGLDYTIGQDELELDDIDITTNGTTRDGITQQDLVAWVKQAIPLSIGATIERFNLRDPALYRRIAQGADFFQDKELGWNKPRDVEYR